MSEGIVTTILALVGALLLVFVVADGVYITFYPLTKTIGEGMEA